jgi:hypothetical protein
MKHERKVLSGTGVLFALCLAKRNKMNVVEIVSLLNKAGEE